MISWANDDELFEIMKTELYTAVVGDILDTMHYYHQFLPQKIQPMSENMIVAGRAMPVAECDIDNLTEQESGLISSNPADEAIKLKECEYVWMAVLQLGSQILPSSLLDFMQ